jgi:hypothetical protein
VEQENPKIFACPDKLKLLEQKSTSDNVVARVSRQHHSDDSDNIYLRMRL